MSPENLTFVHEVYEAMNRRDVGALEEMAKLYPEYEWHNGADMPESQLRVGRESTIGYVRELFTTFDQTHTTIREVIDCGDAGAIFMVGGAGSANAMRARSASPPAISFGV